MAVRIIMHHQEINQFLHSPSGKVYRHFAAIMRATDNGAKRRAPVREGDLRGSIYHTMASGGLGLIGRCGATSAHAIYVHQGTHTPIWPRSAKLLRLRAGNGYPVLYRREVRGQKPNPFLVRAFVVACPYEVTVTS